MANTYTLIASSTVGSGGTSSIDFTNIPNSYTNLVARYSLRTDNANAFSLTYVYLNGSQTGYIAAVQLEGTGAAVSSSAFTTTYLYADDGSGNTTTSNTFGNGELYIPNYASADDKSISVDSVGENNATTAYSQLISGWWDNSAAVNRITFSTSASSLSGSTTKFMQHSTIYLYGINKS